MKYKFYELTKEEKDLIRNGELKPTVFKWHIVCPHKFQSDAIQEFLNRSKGQCGCKKPRKKKKPSSNKSIQIIYPVNERTIPSAAVGRYLNHLQSLRPNAYSYKVNRVLKMNLDETDRVIVSNLDPVPLYNLRYSNRIFCSGRWQTLKTRQGDSGKPLRNLLFKDCINADFRSLHFEIFRMLLRQYVPETDHELTKLLGALSVWDYLEEVTSGVLEKGVYKIAVQALINGSSKSQANKRLLVDQRDLIALGIDEHDATEFENLLTQINLHRFIKIVYQGVNVLQSKIKNHEIFDAFGESVHPTTIDLYRSLTGIWMPENEKWKLRRKDLNRLYSSYELKILSETVAPCLGKHEFRVDLHLHDGFLFTANKKSIFKVQHLLETSSQNVLRSLGIASEIRFETLPELKIS